MHVIKARPDPSKMAAEAYGLGPTKAVTTGSGLSQMAAAASRPAQAQSASDLRPPSTRQFAKDYAAFWGNEGALTGKQMAHAKAIKSGKVQSSSNQPPSTRQFAKAYQAFYDVENLNDQQLDQVRSIKNRAYPSASQTAAAPQRNGSRISTGMREDPNFRANLARFHGGQASQEDEIYKNYRAFFGGATPNVNQASHMGKAHQEQQRTILRGKLAENAKRILNTKNFGDGFQAPKRSQSLSQADLLKQSGFDPRASAIAQKTTQEPASYAVHEASGAAAFKYNRNPKVDKVTKTDPPIKNLGKARYNIITGSLQEWF